jgi:hypothetical protein
MELSGELLGKGLLRVGENAFLLEILVMLQGHGPAAKHLSFLA